MVPVYCQSDLPWWQQAEVSDTLILSCLAGLWWRHHGCSRPCTSHIIFWVNQLNSTAATDCTGRPQALQPSLEGHCFNDCLWAKWGQFVPGCALLAMKQTGISQATDQQTISATDSSKWQWQRPTTGCALESGPSLALCLERMLTLMCSVSPTRQWWSDYLSLTHFLHLVKYAWPCKVINLRDEPIKSPERRRGEAMSRMQSSKQRHKAKIFKFHASACLRLVSGTSWSFVQAQGFSLKTTATGCLANCWALWHLRVRRRFAMRLHSHQQTANTSDAWPVAQRTGERRQRLAFDCIELHRHPTKWASSEKQRSDPIHTHGRPTGLLDKTKRVLTSPFHQNKSGSDQVIKRCSPLFDYFCCSGGWAPCTALSRCWREGPPHSWCPQLWPGGRTFPSGCRKTPCKWRKKGGIFIISVTQQEDFLSLDSWEQVSCNETKCVTLSWTGLDQCPV